ncbi:MAG: hypothetical protein E5V62_07600 [Mesorhizobium sp.]|uniref:hypothetical protein n=1 Tax=Mesorhizobium sp. TaxID=1871066 RepID=UPI000FD2948D|nr:hypothetical protein [Mesorhizobium sp.]RVD73341.1 hypothetical protein EN751_05375 [Mesorhizobium sp. M4A.F.Ca.ET.029.04.2.1]TIW36212.1 MAG: hypothetical protein E5V62_07600 [Mesorhizobium sp.]
MTDKLNDLTCEAGHLATLLDVLVDLTIECCNPSLEKLRKVNALVMIAKDMADRHTDELEEYHKRQIEAAKRAA